MLHPRDDVLDVLHHVEGLPVAVSDKRHVQTPLHLFELVVNLNQSVISIVIS